MQSRILENVVPMSVIRARHPDRDEDLKRLDRDEEELERREYSAVIMHRDGRMSTSQLQTELDQIEHQAALINAERAVINHFLARVWMEEFARLLDQHGLRLAQDPDGRLNIAYQADMMGGPVADDPQWADLSFSMFDGVTGVFGLDIEFLSRLLGQDQP